VRKSTTEYPSSSGTKAMAHKDMMVIYRQPHEASLKAIYFDNEGHIIDYTSQFPDEKTIQFTSKLLPGRPAFRLTYIFSDTDNMTINFEISSNGNEDNFKSYVTGSAWRKK
jgi:hypothetical protein